MLALALLAAWSTVAGASGWTTCAALENSELLAPAVPAARPWDAVRAAFLDYLASLPDDPAAARAAAFLRRSSLTLSARPVSASAGTSAEAEYDPVARTIYFEQEDAAALWSRWDPPGERAQALAAFVRRQAPVLVHELFHARLRAELGPVPPFAEEELLADAEETLFVMGRLRSDPDAWGLRTLDDELGGGAGPRWWADAPRRSAAELDWRAQAAGDASLAERWRMVRAMGAGYEAFGRALREGGVLDGDSVFALDERRRRRAIDETRALRQAHERCLAGAGASERDGLRGWIDRLDAEELAYEDEGRLGALASGFKRRMDAQRAEARRLRAP